MPDHQLGAERMNVPWNGGTAAVVLVASLVIVGYLAFRLDVTSRQPLRAAISAEILEYRRGRVRAIDFSKVARFGWDKLYIIRPYTSPDQIDSILGTFWLGSRFTTIESNDGIALPVFMQRGHVTQYVEFLRGTADFASAASPEAYDRDSARSTLDEDGRASWLGSQ